MRNQLSDARVKEIIREEIILLALQEGIWDDVTDGAKRLRAAATKKFASLSGPWAENLRSTLKKFESMPKEIDGIMAAIRSGMKQTGESLNLDETLQAARSLGKLGTSDALALAQDDLAGPVHDKAEQVSKSTQQEAAYHVGICSVLLEREHLGSQRGPINELGIVGGLGVGMATLGGSIMLFKGLSKLAHWLGAEKTSHLFHRVEKVLHGLETSAIDKVIPDRLAYAVYAVLFNKGLKLGTANSKDDSGEDVRLKFDEFKAGDGHSMAKVKGLMYKAVLIYFAWHGIEAALHAGASLLGFVEGAASGVKGVEIAVGAKELMKLAGNASAAFDV